MAKSMRKFMGMGDVRNAIRRLGKQISAELKDEEIFQSEEFKSYARSVATFVLRKYKLFNLMLHHDTSPDAPVAYTDGKNIVLNTGNSLAAKPKLLEGRFKVNMGVLFHECGHKLFMDFDLVKRASESIQQGKLYGTFNVEPGSELENNYRELEQTLADGYKKSLNRIYHQIQNIINDGHDEQAMKRVFPGFIAQCINYADDVQMEGSIPLREYVDKGAPELEVFFSLMLQYAKNGYCNIGEECDAMQPYLDTFSQMESVIDEAVAEDNCEARWTHFNTLMLILWPTIRKMKEEQENNSGNGNGGAGGAGGSGSGGNSMISDEALEAMAESLAAAAEAANSASAAPQGAGKGVSVQAVADGAGDSAGDASDALGSIMDQIGQEKAAQQVQSEIDQAQLEAIRKTNKPLIHKKVPVKTYRHHEPDKEAYDEIYREVEPYVRNLISQIVALLREYNEEALIRHKRVGPIIEATEAYRPDGAFFAKKKLPEDRPNMAMCILLDESGSMYGEKMRIAKKAMIMLERFAAGVGVPLMVAGHYTSGSNVMLNIYTDFISANPDKDRYALGGIDSHGCNRDGLPLRLCAEMLAKRPEDIRMMVTISDGAPNHNDYEGEEAFEDIKKTVHEFRRQGLLMYGAAIDEDREVIQELYGKGFLSISDLKSLPKTMVRLLRQNIT